MLVRAGRVTRRSALVDRQKRHRVPSRADPVILECWAERWVCSSPRVRLTRDHSLRTTHDRRACRARVLFGAGRPRPALDRTAARASTCSRCSPPLARPNRGRRRRGVRARVRQPGRRGPEPDRDVSGRTSVRGPSRSRTRCLSPVLPLPLAATHARAHDEHGSEVGGAGSGMAEQREDR